MEKNVNKKKMALIVSIAIISIIIILGIIILKKDGNVIQYGIFNIKEAFGEKDIDTTENDSDSQKMLVTQAVSTNVTAVNPNKIAENKITYTISHGGDDSVTIDGTTVKGNTSEYFELAAKSGCFGVEADYSGETDDEGNLIMQHTGFTGNGILTDLLKSCKAYDTLAVIDMKSLDNLEDLVENVTALGMENNVVFQGNNGYFAALKEAADVYGVTLRYWYLCLNPDNFSESDFQTAVDTYGVEAINVDTYKGIESTDSVISLLKNKFPNVALCVYQYDGPTDTETAISKYSPNYVMITSWSGETSPKEDNFGKNISYTVRHYIRDAGKTTYSLYVTENQTAALTDKIKIEDLKLTMQGFTYEGGVLAAQTAEKPDQFDTEVQINGSGLSNINIYYDRNSYTVTFKNGDTEIEKKTIEYGEKAEPSTALEKKGYTLTWMNGDEEFSSDSTIKEDTTLVAKWMPNTYQIKFDGNNATSGEMENQTLTYDTSSKLSKNTYARTGYTFKGWNTREDGKGIEYEDEQEVENLTTQKDEIITLYAIWNKSDTTTYTVKFDSNGGTEISDINLEENEKITEPETPSKTGYTFKGWYYKNDDGEIAEYDFTKEVTKDLTLAAKWEANTYQIKFDGNGATSGEMENQELTYDTSSKLSKNTYARTGYTFKGWNTKEDGTGIEYEDEQEVENLTTQKDEIITIYAIWNKLDTTTYTVKFDSNGGTEISDINVEENEKVTEPETPSKTGYTFKGWYYKNDDGEIAEYDFTKEVTKDLTLAAKWEANTYQIKFDGNGATSGEMENQELIYDTSSKLTQNTYSKTGYTFSGWNTKKDGTGNQYADSQTAVNLTSANNETITLYAIWKANTYQIKFDGNGATSGTMQNETLTYDEEESLTKNTYVRTDYNFKGWGETKDTVKYEDEEKVKNLTSTNNEIITLYAVWEKEQEDTGTNTLTYKIEHYKQDIQGNYKLTETETLYGKEGETVTVSYKTYEGYTANGTKSVITGKIPSSGTLTLKAYYDINSYTIQFDANGGAEATKGDLDSQAVKYGQTVTKPQDPVRTGYTFKGWIYNNSEYDFNTTVKSNITLKANWEKTKYEVTFNIDGKTTTQEVEYGSKATKPETPTKEGYIFEGWYYKNAEGEEVEYDFKTAITENTNIYAKWAKISNTEESENNTTINGKDTTTKSGDTTVTSSVLPYTGLKIVFGAIVLAVIILFINYKKYRNMRDI